MQVTLALGSNLGDRHAILTKARQLIAERIGPVLEVSSLLETEAWGVTEQPDFLNQVIVVRYQPFLGAAAGAKEVSLKAVLHRLLDLTQSIETALGRQRKTHWGPRTCDVDIIFVDDLRYEDERLSLPHPWWAVREFVGGIIKADLAHWLPGLQATP
jgi:2-amino-4-hydroxy-6-hydroxymethyldihydropteridine diphosphokinase